MRSLVTPTLGKGSGAGQGAASGGSAMPQFGDLHACSVCGRPLSCALVTGACFYRYILLPVSRIVNDRCYVSF